MSLIPIPQISASYRPLASLLEAPIQNWLLNSSELIRRASEIYPTETLRAVEPGAIELAGLLQSTEERQTVETELLSGDLRRIHAGFQSLLDQAPLLSTLETTANSTIIGVQVIKDSKTATTGRREISLSICFADQSAGFESILNSGSMDPSALRGTPLMPPSSRNGKKKEPLWGRAAKKSIAAVLNGSGRLKDRNASVDPSKSPVTIPVQPSPQRLGSFEEARARMTEWVGQRTGRATGLGRRADDAIQRTQKRIQEFRETSRPVLDRVLQRYEILSKAAAGRLNREYRQVIDSTTLRITTADGKMYSPAPEEVEFLLIAEKWKEWRNPERAWELSDEDLAHDGFSMLTAPLMGLTVEGERGILPVEGLPQPILMQILEDNEWFNAEPHRDATQRLKTAANHYYGRLNKDSNHQLRHPFAAAMAAFVADPGRARSLTVELAMMNALLLLLLKNPHKLLYEILFDHHARVGNSDRMADDMIRFFKDAHQALDEAEKLNLPPREIARRQQILENALAVLVYRLGPSLLSEVLKMNRYEMLEALPGHYPSLSLDDLRVKRQRLHQESARISGRQREVFASAAPHNDEYWDKHRDAALPAIWWEGMESSLARSEEEMSELRQKAGMRHDKAFALLKKEALNKRAILFKIIDDRLNKRAPVHSLTLNRDLEAVIGAFLKLEEAVQKWSRKAGIETKVPDHVVPLFSGFSSKWNPLSFADRIKIADALVLLAGSSLAEAVILFRSGDQRGYGTRYADHALLLFAGRLSQNLSHTVFVGEPESFQVLAGAAGVSSQQHLSWAADFDSMIGALLMTNPNQGDPLTFQPPRILAKTGLGDKMGVPWIDQLTVGIDETLYRGREIMSSRTVALGELTKNLDNARQVSDLERTKYPTRLGPRFVGLFPQLTMPVADALNPFDDDPESSLRLPPVSEFFAGSGRDFRIAMAAEALSGRRQALIWSTNVNSYRQYPKPDGKIRLYEGDDRMVVSSPIYLDELPGIRDLHNTSWEGSIRTWDNLQRYFWLQSAFHPANMTRPLREASGEGSL